MRYDIEADWHLLNACNYRCAYCFLPPAVLGEKLQTVASPRQWQTAFHRTRLKWLLHMTGGEPSIYPHFVELCRLLTEDHFISINSNLTNACLVDFAEKIEPKRVCFINAGMHLEERDFREGQREISTSCSAIACKGFSCPRLASRNPDGSCQFRGSNCDVAAVRFISCPQASSRSI